MTAVSGRTLLPCHCEKPTGRTNGAPDERNSARVEMTVAAKQSSSALGAKWIASSQGLLAMTRKWIYFMGYISSQTLKGASRSAMGLEGLRPQRKRVKEGSAVVRS